MQYCYPIKAVDNFQAVSADQPENWRVFRDDLKNRVEKCLSLTDFDVFKGKIHISVISRPQMAEYNNKKI